LLSAIKENSGIKAKDLNSLLNGRPVKTIERQIKTLIKNNGFEIIERLRIGRSHALLFGKGL